MKRLTTFVLFVLFPVLILAQSIHKNAKIITSNGDTVFGFVKDEDWLENPSRFILFNSSDSARKRILDINNTKSVLIENDDYFKSYTLPISMDEVRYSMLHVGPDTSKNTKSVFLKVLVEGCYVNLYSYTDEIKTRYFYSDQSSSTPRELRYRTYFADDKLSVITDKYYIRQLSYLASTYAGGNKELSNKLKSPAYLRDDLIKIFTLINGEKNATYCPVVVTQNKTKLQFYLQVGLRRSTLSYMQYQTYHKLTSNCSKIPSYSPYIGIGLNIKSTYESKLFFREELGFSIDNLKSKDRYSEPLNYTTEDFEYSLHQANFTLSNILIYRLINADKSKGYLGTGLNLNYSKISRSEYTSQVLQNTHSYILQEESILGSSRIWFSVPIKVSYVINNRIDLNCTYYLPISQNNDTKFNIWEVGLACYFKK